MISKRNIISNEKEAKIWESLNLQAAYRHTKLCKTVQDCASWFYLIGKYCLRVKKNCEITRIVETVKVKSYHMYY